MVNESSKQFKESEKRQNFTKDFDIDELERKNEALKALILPKIGGTSIQVSNAESQLKIHRAKQY